MEFVTDPTRSPTGCNALSRVYLFTVGRGPYLKMHLEAIRWCNKRVFTPPLPTPTQPHQPTHPPFPQEGPARKEPLRTRVSSIGSGGTGGRGGVVPTERLSYWEFHQKVTTLRNNVSNENDSGRFRISWFYCQFVMMFLYFNNSLTTWKVRQLKAFASEISQHSLACQTNLVNLANVTWSLCVMNTELLRALHDRKHWGSYACSISGNICEEYQSKLKGLRIKNSSALQMTFFWIPFNGV